MGSSPPYAKKERGCKKAVPYFFMKNSLITALRLSSLASSTEDWSVQDKLTAMILENFLAMAATAERESIRVRTSGGRMQKAKSGGYAGGQAPMGYTVQDGRMIVNENEKVVVEFIFSMREQGRTMKEIVCGLNSCGFKTRRGGLFQISTVQSILNNRKTYEGFYKYGKGGEWVKGQHEPILPSQDA